MVSYITDVQEWVQKKIFGPKREERTGDWRRLQNEERHDLYFLSDVIRVIK